MKYNKVPLFLFNAHLETIYPSLIRRVNLKPYERERITTPDSDFLDLDWLTQSSKKLIVISHGLEGSTQRPYIKGLARALFLKGFDVLAWNFRSCSEEMNKQIRFYHSGATEDLDVVVQHAIKKNFYEEISLVGFSLGGNLTLKYIGERVTYAIIKKVVAISVPLNLHTSCTKISHPSNWVYSNRFLRSLKTKIIRKHKTHPEIRIQGLEKIKTLQQFDDQYTAPLHGFESAIDYYDRCSSINFLEGIKLPTLIINAQNDPFLSPECFPVDRLMNHNFIRFENPIRGGHVGFAQFGKNGMYWSEERALDFLSNDATH